MKGVDLHYAHLHYEAPIVHITFADNVDIGFLEVRELIHYAEELSGHRPYVVLSDARWGVNVTPLGLKTTLGKDATPLHRGTAVWVNSLALKVATNLYGRYAHPSFPYRAFTDKEKALDWLLSLPLEDLRRLER